MVGAYAINNSMVDVYFMFAFGIVAYFLEEMGYPIAPLVIAIILGPMADEKLRTALVAHQGSLAPFFTRPIALVLMALIAWSVLSRMPLWRSLWRRSKRA